MTDPLTSRRIDDLEHRLDEYHSEVTRIADQRDLFALDAAWGVSQALASLLSKLTAAVFAGGAYLAVSSLTHINWLPFVAAVIVYVIAETVGERRLHKKLQAGRNEDRRQLDAFPTWQNKAEDRW